jgi:cytochrome b561
MPGVDAALPLSRPRWSLPVRWLHALAALVIITTLGYGLAMTHLIDSAGAKFDAYQTHKSLGFLVLALMLVRLLVRLTHPAPPPVGARWQRLLATITHRAFYVLLLAMPLLGWAMISATVIRVPIRVFDLVPLPFITGPDIILYGWLRTAHAATGWLVCGLLIMHIAGALVHQKERLIHGMWNLRRFSSD